MKAIFLNTPFEFYFIPRNFPVETDTLSLSLRNEFDGTILTPTVFFEVGQRIKITIDSQSFFKAFEKYEVEIKNGNEIIYLGKMIVLNEGENTQNYNYGNRY